MSHASIDFYLRELDLSSNAVLATIEGGEITLYPSFDDRIEFNMEVALAQNFFRFVSDSSDISDNTTDDILFRHHNAFTANLPLGDKFMVRNQCVSTLAHLTETHKSLPDNYLRHLALYLFNTYKGVDLFNNELNVREQLRLDTLERMEDILNALHTRDGASENALPSMATTIDNPARTIFRHILKADSKRLTPLHPVPTSETHSKVLALNSVEYYMPLFAGDSLAFLVEVIADPTQNGVIDTPLTGDILIPNHKFLVVANLVGTNHWDTDSYKDAIVLEFQAARTLAVNAKSALETAAATLASAVSALAAAQAVHDADPSVTNRDSLSAASDAKVAASNTYNLLRAEHAELKRIANGLWNVCQPGRDSDDLDKSSYQ